MALITLADVPGTPTTEPYKDASKSSFSVLTIHYDAIPSSLY
jgi:hypothetical protein